MGAGAGDQLLLGVRPKDAASLGSFEPGDNGAALAWLEGALGSARAQRGWFHGRRGTGRSHLLEGACREIQARDGRAIHLAAEFLREAPAAMLEGLEACELVAVDDVDLLAGDEAAELALFDLVNRLAAADRILLLTAAAPPRACDFRLPDLVSRFAAATVFRLEPLDDAGRLAALRRRARLRGIDLSEDTARYILERFPRDPVALFGLLEELDRASLSAHRRVTIRFVRERFGNRP